MRDIQTTLMGNATADPKSRPQEDGTLSASVRIAVTSRYYDSSKNDFTDRKTEFITVFARRALARNLLSSVKKGTPLVVTGRLGSSEWEAEGGVMRHSLTLQAEAIGPDLTFGTATFLRPLKEDDVPDHDPQTGEVQGSGGDEEEESSLAAAQSEGAELEPAF